MTATRPTTVDEYIKQAPLAFRKKLQTLRQAIKKAAPKAEEKISYGMPYYHFYGRLAYFAAFKDHYSFFMMKHVLIKHDKEVKKYKTGAATMRFSYEKEIPLKLITKMVKYGVKVNLEKADLKNKKLDR